MPETLNTEKAKLGKLQALVPPLAVEGQLWHRPCHVGGKGGHTDCYINFLLLTATGRKEVFPGEVVICGLIFNRAGLGPWALSAGGFPRGAWHPAVLLLGTSDQLLGARASGRRQRGPGTGAQLSRGRGNGPPSGKRLPFPFLRCHPPSTALPQAQGKT